MAAPVPKRPCCKDPVWEYAKRIKPNKFKCSFCNDSFFGTARRLKFHLSHAGGGHVRQCPAVSPDVRDKCLHWLLSRNSSAPSSAEDKGKAALETVQISETVCRWHGSNVDAATTSGSGSCEQEGAVSVRMSVYRFLKANGLPPETVEEPTFMDMFCNVAHFGSAGIPAPKDLHELEGFMVDEDEECQRSM